MATETIASNGLPYYRINDWLNSFETAKSKTIGHKSWGVYPLKHGAGYCRMMMKPDGPAAYGVFIAMVSIVHSKPKESREGYLTDTGGIPGYPYDIEDIASLTRMSIDAIREAIPALLKARWISLCDSSGNIREDSPRILEGYREDTARIPRDPLTEGTDRTEEKRREDTETSDCGFDEFWNLYDLKADMGRAVRYWTGKTRLKDGTRINDAIRAEIMAAVPAYVRSTPDKQYRKGPATYLYNSAWLDEIVRRSDGANGRATANGRQRLANEEQDVQWPTGEVYDVSNVP